MFVGNPFATDNGEIDQKKGFLIYDAKLDKVTRIPSKVPGIYSWAYVKKHKPKLIEGTRIRATVECTANDNYHKLLDKTASTIERKYPKCIAYVVPKFADVQQQNDYVEINPESTDYEKIASYIRTTLPVELKHKRKALMQYIPHVLNQTSSGIRQSGRIVFDNISASNVLSFAKLNFSFRNRGVVLVKGQNKDSWMSSNGAGKTNFLSMLPVCLYGKTFKDQKNDEWANDNNKEKALAKLTILDDRNRKLEVIRGRRPVKLKFLIDGVDESKGRRHVGKKETQGLIEQTIGYTFETFANSVYLDSELQNAFLLGTDKDRALIIHKLQNMDRFSTAQKLIAQEMSLLRKQEQKLETEQEIAETLLEQVLKDIVSSKKRNKETLEKYKEAKRQAKENLDTFKLSLTQLKLVLDSKLKKSSALLTKIKETEQLLYKELQTLESKLDIKKEERKSFEELGSIKKCPTCFQDLTEENKKKLIARFTKTISSINTQIKKKLFEHTCVENHILAIQGPIDSIRKEIEDNNVKTDRARDAYNLRSEELRNAKLNSSEDRSNISQLIRRKRKLNKDIARIKRVLSHLIEDNKFLSYAQESMGRDGLPAFLNKMIIPLLNKAAAKYSDLFVDKEISVIFDLEDGSIVPQIRNVFGGKSIKSQSAGEKAWSGIITSFALREIASPTNLLILDEPGNGLDEASAKQFGERLPRLKSRFETILIVSHNRNIIAALDNDRSVTVTKKNKFSSIK